MVELEVFSGVETFKTTIADTWDSFLGRIIIIGLAIGWVPFYFLTMAHQALSN